MKTKDEAYALTKQFVERSEVKTNERLNFFQSDGGGEYDSKRFRDYLALKGIHHEKTTAYTPQQNGVAERMNRTLVEMARAMLHDAGLPNSYCGDAILHATYILNRVPTQALKGDITPHEVYLGAKPSVANLRIFGCKVFVYIPDEKRKKLDSKSLECTFLGYVENKSAYCHRLVVFWNHEMSSLMREMALLVVSLSNLTLLSSSQITHGHHSQNLSLL
ncbi:hypothetical protein PHLCEN_2v10250 [Hermanssonia centrifuga]|uniref:Integrase catalytic domain-containing protein n=1 Tax=Hermanssonia centrifuga TaxID=98765 RepID=A0A2R6NNF8_9APHY|nr:hypothetical protein PHLCEN_2v10250 [Hermanssonia centrifuga]